MATKAGVQAVEGTQKGVWVPENVSRDPWQEVDVLIPPGDVSNIDPKADA